MKVVKIYNITDKEYEAYGRSIDEGLSGRCSRWKEMEKTPAGSTVIYIASDAGLEALDQAKVLQRRSFFGGMPIQVGYC